MLIAAIVLLLGIGAVAAIVRNGDEGPKSVDQTSGPGATTTTSSSTATSSSSSSSAPSSSAAPSSTAAGGTGETTAPANAPTTAPAAVPGATTSTTAPVGGSSGLGTGGAGQVAMGPTTPNTGIESTLAPGVTLIAAGTSLRALLGPRRQRRRR